MWSTQRGSFSAQSGPPRMPPDGGEVARMRLQREHSGVRVGRSNNSARPVNTPSPANSEGSGTLPFQIPLQPVPKTVRSMSHSQGQREPPNNPPLGVQPGPVPVLPLGLLAEEDVDTETESDLGDTITHTMSNPPGLASLQRTSTFPSGYGINYGSHGRGEDEDYDDTPASNGKIRRKLEHALTSLSIDQPRRPQWHTSLGWDGLPNITESRRHSLADIPTRRGSTAGEHARAINEMNGHARDLERATRQLQEAQYHVPMVTLEPHERTPRPLPPPHPSQRNKQKTLYVVSFKCARVEIFYLMDNTGLEINEGDMVIVEADRGQDLGMVQHARVTPDEARILKRKYAEEQYKWLMMFSVNNSSGNINPNAPGAMNQATSPAESSSMGASRSGPSVVGQLPPKPYSMPGAIGGPMVSKDDLFNLKPKAIKRIANSNEVKMLMDKEGNEAKAKRTCQTKVNVCRLDMEILDAEWQWDFNKIIFYYYADHYINFQGLITELYRIYKTRIWLSAVNPASFSPAATGQMPFGFGPGAILNMMGQDPDPHGAVRPYSVDYNTHDPSYASAPGIPTSFPPTQSPTSGYGGSQFPQSQVLPGMNMVPGGQTMPQYSYGSMLGNFGQMSLGGEASPGATAAPLPGVGHFAAASPSTAAPPSNPGWSSGNMGPSALAPYSARQAALPLPIGTRPSSNGTATSSVGVLGAVGGGRMPMGGGGLHGGHGAGAVDPRGLTFGSMPFSSSSSAGNMSTPTPGKLGAGPDGDEVVYDPHSRMRSFLERGPGAPWAARG